MKKSRFTDEQIIGMIKEQEAVRVYYPDSHSLHSLIQWDCHSCPSAPRFVVVLSDAVVEA